MQDKDPVELAEIERDLEESGIKHKPFDPDEDTEYDVWVQKTYMKDKTAVIAVFKDFGQNDTLEQTIDKLVTLIDKARRHG